MEPMDKVQRILDVLLRYTVLDFSEKIPIGYEEDEMDAIALGLNTLAHELQEHISLLDQRNRQISTIVDHAPAAIFMLNSNLEVIDWNPKAATKFGYQLEEIENKSIVPLIVHPNFHDRFHRILERVDTDSVEPNPAIAEFLLMRRNGELFEAELRLTATMYNEERLLIGMVRDISAQKEYEKMIVRAKKEAEESSKLKEAFLANMSHEIRTPMNAIIGFTDLLLQRPLETIERDYVDTIKRSSELLLSLVNDILDVSKIEAGLLEFDIQTIDLMDINKSIQDIFEQKAKDKGLEMHITMDTKIPRHVRGDGLRWSQILINLTNNAIKFTEAGSVEISMKLIDKGDDNVWISCKVKDTGIGIPEEKLPAIFDRFHQVQAGHNRSHGGTGLGLSISKQLVELQGGKISVTSTVNVGTEFEVQMPFGAQMIKLNSSSNLSDSHALNLEAIQGLRVLLVEDNPLNVKLMEHIVKPLNWNMTVAMNGRLALDELASLKVDVILMDIEMPELNGYESTKIIREELMISTPILAMTAHAMTGERERCLTAGMNDYITKPLDTNDLFRKIGMLTNGLARV